MTVAAHVSAPGVWLRVRRSDACRTARLACAAVARCRRGAPGREWLQVARQVSPACPPAPPFLARAPSPSCRGVRVSSWCVPRSAGSSRARELGAVRQGWRSAACRHKRRSPARHRADAPTARCQADDEPTKKRSFRKFTFRGVDLDQLLDLTTDELVQLFHARARRRCAARQGADERASTRRAARRTAFRVRAGAGLPSNGVAPTALARSCVAAAGRTARAEPANARAAPLSHALVLAALLTNPRLDCSFQRGLKRKSLTLIKKLRKAARARCIARAGRR